MMRNFQAHMDHWWKRYLALIIATLLLINFIARPELVYIFEHRGDLASSEGAPLMIIKGAPDNKGKTGWRHPPMTFAEILWDAQGDFKQWEFLEQAGGSFDKPVRKVEIKVWLE